jgi:AsmA protein
MKRSVKIGLAVLVGLPILAAIAIRLFVDANTFKPIIESQLSTALSRKVTLGDLSLSVFAGNLVADNLTISEDPKFGTTPFLSAKQLRMGVQMEPLVFHRQLIIRSFEADSPDIHLIHGPDNTWNFASLSHEPSTHDTSKQSAFPNLSVGHIAITNGRAIIDSSPHPQQKFDNLNIALENFSLTKSFPFTVSATVPGDGHLNAEGTVGPINPSDAASTAFDAQVAIKHLDPVAASFVDANSGIAFLGNLDAHIVSDGATATSDGKIHADKLILLKGGRPTPQPVDIAYSIVHSLQQNAGQVKDLAIQTGKVAVHVKGTYQIAGNVPSFNLKLAANSLPIDSLQALMPAVGVKLPNGSVLKGGTLTTNLNIVGTPTNNVISGPIQLDNTQLVGFNLGSKLSGVAAMSGVKTGDILAIQTMRANVRVSKAGIEANDVYSNLPALGESSGSGTVAPNGAMNFRMVAKVTTAHGLGKAGVDILTKLNSTAANSAKTAAANGVPVTITGTADNPVITADVSGVVKANASALGGQADQILKKTGLAGLFGKK